MASLSGQVVLVTGGAGGFGNTFVQKFLELGCKVCIGDVNLAAGKEAEESFSSKFGPEKVLFTKLDVTCDKSFKDAFLKCDDTLGKVDILINNAGIGNETDFQKTLSVNLGGSIRGTEIALEHMSKAKDNGGGRVVNIASIAGLKDLPFGPFYSASKSGIIHYTRAAGHPFHFSYTGVTIQCLCPSLVDTPFIQITPEGTYNPRTGAAVKSLFGKVPLLQPAEIADALITLIEDNKPGAVMAVEKGKEPYYVSPSVPSA